MIKTYIWNNLKTNQIVLVDEIEHKIIYKGAYNILFLHSSYTNGRPICKLREDGTIHPILNENRRPLGKGEPPTMDTMVYKYWDDEVLEKAKNPRLMWKDPMQCGHLPKRYQTIINTPDNKVRIRFECVEGCLTEWHECGEMPLPHTHAIALDRVGE